MARLKIVHLNKMTCGERRGLVDMDVKVEDIMPEVFLLAGTNLSTNLSNDFPPPQHAAGIVTESNVDYEYDRSLAIYDYHPQNKKSQMRQENSHLVLNEQQTTICADTVNNSLSSTGNLSGSSIIQLTPEFWVLSADKAREEYEKYDANKVFRIVYEFELDPKTNAKACLNPASGSPITQYLPLNDILDLCVKSMFKKAVENRAIPGNLLLKDYNMTYSKNVDQYFVFEKNPVDFCQYSNDAFVMSDTTTNQPYRLQSDIYDQIQANAIGNAHQFSLTQDPIDTVLYKPVSKYKNSSGGNASSYAQYVAANGGFLSYDKLVDVFTPYVALRDISYNYIVNIEQSKNPNRQFDNPTIYDNGDIFGSFYTGKNMYNSLYNVNVNDGNKLLYCRTYAGIQNAGDRIVLKYYDNANYQFDNTQQGTTNAQMLSTSSSFTGVYPYQKVETFDPVQFGTNTKHKSNLFSIKLYNTGLDDDSVASYDASTKKLAENLKKDISNAMKELVQSIAPANTQLFATYFMGPED